MKTKPTRGAGLVFKFDETGNLILKTPDTTSRAASLARAPRRFHQLLGLLGRWGRIRPLLGLHDRAGAPSSGASSGVPPLAQGWPSLALPGHVLRRGGPSPRLLSTNHSAGPPCPARPRGRCQGRCQGRHRRAMEPSSAVCTCR